MAPNFPYQLRLQVDKDVVVIVYRMRICIRAPAPTLKVLSAYKTAVDVNVG